MGIIWSDIAFGEKSRGRGNFGKKGAINYWAKIRQGMVVTVKGEGGRWDEEPKIPSKER